MSADEPSRSILERAAERLEQLQRSGVVLPASAAAAAAPVLAYREVTVPPVPALPSEAPVKVETVAARPANDGAALPQHRVDIDIERLTQAGYLSPRAERTALAEEFRNIKRPLLAKARVPAAMRANLIMVTSALRAEGKTFASINLAISMASEFDTSVLLVDADTARPSLLTRLGVSARRGLTDLLQDAALGLPDVLLATNIEGLTLLPSGTHHPSATEMLASDAMRRLVTRLEGHGAGRIVLFDAPPLLATSEARVLAPLMGQIVALVEAEKTPEAAVREMLTILEACPDVTLVLNKARQSRTDHAYGGYGY